MQKVTGQVSLTLRAARNAGFHRLFCRLRLDQHRFAVLIKGLPASVPQTAGLYAESNARQAFFELRDPAAQAWIWADQAPCPPRQTTVIDHLDKPGEVIEILHPSSIVPFLEQYRSFLLSTGLLVRI
jgi:hypothetical protein